jgi:hypothetical protein
MSGLQLGIVLSVCTCWFHSMITFPPRLVSTDFGTCSYHCFVSNCTPVSLHMLKCSCAPTISCLFIYEYYSFASVGQLLLLLLLLQELEGSLQSAPGKLYALKCDVTKEQEIKEAFKWVKDNLGGVDILVNNAGADRLNTLCGNSNIICVYCHLLCLHCLL